MLCCKPPTNKHQRDPKGQDYLSPSTRYISLKKQLKICTVTFQLYIGCKLIIQVSALLFGPLTPEMGKCKCCPGPVILQIPLLIQAQSKKGGRPGERKRSSVPSFIPARNLKEVFFLNAYTHQRKLLCSQFLFFLLSFYICSISNCIHNFISLFFLIYYLDNGFSYHSF